MTSTFRVGITRDLRGDDGRPRWDLALDLLDAEPAIEWSFLPRRETELTAATIAALDAIMVWEPGGVTRATLAGADRLRLIARFGMGLESIDLDACDELGIVVTTEPSAVRHAIPAGAMALVLGLAHRLVEKDAVVRAGGWDERFDHVGAGTTGRTLGVIGLGNVGRGVVRMAEPFGFHRVAHDPYADPAAVPGGVELVDLETLLRRSDVVCVTCPLTPETHHLLDRGRMALLPRGAQVVNVARGPIVDTLALAEALRDGRLSGAALDVFEQEPLAPDHPLLGLDSVILSPHAIGYTDAAIRGLGAGACRSVLAFARGDTPAHVSNPAALTRRTRRTHDAA